MTLRSHCVPARQPHREPWGGTMRKHYRVVPVLLVLVALLAGCKKTPMPTNEVVAFRVSSLPTSPMDEAWAQVPEHVAKLVPQDLVEPRQMRPTTTEVRVQTVTNGS